MQDGRQQSGQVGQELYGAGLPFILTSRHYRRLDGTGMLAYCEYPICDFESTPDGATLRIGGDPRGSCMLRVAPSDASVRPQAISVRVEAGSVPVPVDGTVSAEGHAVFSVRGGQTVTIRVAKASAKTEHSLVVGALCT